MADWGRLGASFRGYRNYYGIPGGFVGGHDEGVRIEMERASSKFRTVVDEPVGPFDNLRFDATHTWYTHRELESADIVGTLFEQQGASADVLGRHGRWGPFTAGAMGGRASWEDFGYGGSLYTPDTRRLKAALYLLEEVDLGAIQIESGLRYDWTLTDPGEDRDSDIGEIRERRFHSLSGSLGVLYNPGSGLVLGASVVRAFRTPHVTELYSEGPHLAAYVFEVGNPSLEGEVGRGLDVFLRFESDRLRAEVTGFYNDIKNHTYGEDTGRLSRVLLPIYQFRGNDAVFSGFEAGVEVDAGAGARAGGGRLVGEGQSQGDRSPPASRSPAQGTCGRQVRDAVVVRPGGVRDGGSTGPGRRIRGADAGLRRPQCHGGRAPHARRASEHSDGEHPQRREHRVPQPPLPGEGDHAGGRAGPERHLPGGVLTGDGGLNVTYRVVL